MAIESVKSAVAAAVPAPVAQGGAQSRSVSAEMLRAEAADAVERNVKPQSVQPKAGAEDIRQATEYVAQTIQSLARSLNFSVDEDTGKTVVKVVDTDTGELVRQIPAEEILAIAKMLDKLQGLLIHQQA